MQKIICAVLAAASLLTAAIPTAFAADATPDEAVAVKPDALIGDADNDGAVTILDATALQRFLASGESAFAPHWDADGDGSVTVSDVTAIQRCCAGEADCGLAGQRYGDAHPVVLPTTLAFAEDAVKIGVGERYPVELIADGSTDSAVFSTGDSRVAVVAADGNLIGKGAGETVISCACGGLTAKLAVQVCPAAKSLSLNATAITLGVGEQFDLDSYVNSGAAAYFRDYVSDNPSVATVAKAGGMVTAVGAGTANIACVLQNGVRAVCAVTVKPYAPSLSLNATSVTVSVGQSFDFDSYAPSGTAAYYRDYDSENPAVASIAKGGGLMRGVSEGKTRIYCQLQSGVRVYADVTVTNDRARILAFLRDQLGNSNRPYVAYYNSRPSGKKVSSGFAWCAEFAWCCIDQSATMLGKRNMVKQCCHVSEIANQARSRGALYNAFSSSYVPKPGDLFTTAATKHPGTDGRSHIGFVESVETDSKGKVTKVHTIEGNFNWEVAAPTSTKVTRSVWTIGKTRYGAWLCEYINIEKLFS